MLRQSATLERCIITLSKQGEGCKGGGNKDKASTETQELLKTQGHPEGSCVSRGNLDTFEIQRAQEKWLTLSWGGRTKREEDLEIFRAGRNLGGEKDGDGFTGKEWVNRRL